MKKLLFFFLIFPIILSEKTLIESPSLLATYAQNKQEMFKLVRQHAKKYSQGFPKGHNKLLRNMQGSTEFKMTQIPISQLNSLKSRYGLPQELVKQLSLIKYTQNSVYNDVHLHVMKGQSILDNIFGLAKREQNNELFFAYIRGNTNGEIIQQYTTVKVRHCKRRWFRKKCYYVDEKRPRGIDAKELDIIKRTLEAKFYSILHESMNMDNKQIYKIFRLYVNKKKPNYPANWKQVIDERSIKPLIDFQTHEIKLNDVVNFCRKIKLPDTIINSIGKIQNKIGNHMDYYHIYNQDPFSINIIYGVVLRTQNSLVFSFIYGRAQAKISVNQCWNLGKMFRRINPEQCHQIYPKFMSKNAAMRNNVQKVSNQVFFGKFIQLLQKRLSGLDF